MNVDVVKHVQSIGVTSVNSVYIGSIPLQSSLRITVDPIPTYDLRSLIQRWAMVGQIRMELFEYVKNLLICVRSYGIEHFTAKLNNLDPKHMLIEWNPSDFKNQPDVRFRFKTEIEQFQTIFGIQLTQ